MLSFDKDELEISNGSISLRVPASGVWPSPAVFPYHIIEVLISLANTADEEKPLVLEGIGDHLKMGGAKLSCSFQNPVEIVRDVEKAEIRMQQEETNPSKKVSPSQGGGRSQFLAELRKAHPTCTLIPPAHITVVALPDLPNLILRLAPSIVEFRIVQDPDADADHWFEHSKVWKTFNYGEIVELGLANLLRYAAHATAQAMNQKNSEPGS